LEAYRTSHGANQFQPDASALRLMNRMLAHCG
jgi:hypothetical protein